MEWDYIVSQKALGCIVDKTAYNHCNWEYKEFMYHKVGINRLGVVKSICVINKCMSNTTWIKESYIIETRTIDEYKFKCRKLVSQKLIPNIIMIQMFMDVVYVMID